LTRVDVIKVPRWQRFSLAAIRCNVNREPGCSTKDWFFGIAGLFVSSVGMGLSTVSLLPPATAAGKRATVLHCDATTVVTGVRIEAPRPAHARSGAQWNTTPP
jgi:hypothetical protein